MSEWTPERLGRIADHCDAVPVTGRPNTVRPIILNEAADALRWAAAEIERMRADRDRLDWLIALFLGSPHGLNLWHNRALAKSAEYGDQCWGLDRLGWSRRCDEMVATRLGAGRTAREAIDKARGEER